MSKERWIGKEVFIVGDHPHSGRSGVVVRFEVANLANREGAIVKFSNGDECFVFDASLLHLIPTKPAKRRKLF